MTNSLYAALGKTSENVTTQQNVAGQLTPVLTIDPTDGTFIRLLNAVATGSAAGLPIYSKPKDGAGNVLPVDARMALGYKRPSDDSRRVVSNPMATISPYVKKSISQQQDVDNIDSVKHELKGRHLDVRDVDEAYLLMESGTLVDHSNSEFYIEQKGVVEGDLE